MQGSFEFRFNKNFLTIWIGWTSSVIRLEKKFIEFDRHVFPFIRASST